MVISNFSPRRSAAAAPRSHITMSKQKKHRPLGTGTAAVPDQEPGDRFRDLCRCPASGNSGPHRFHRHSSPADPGWFPVRPALPSAAAAPPEITPSELQFCAFFPSVNGPCPLFGLERKIAVFCKLSNNLLTSTSCHYYNRFIKIERWISLIPAILTKKGVTQ